jgi:hypothetical protein
MGRRHLIAVADFTQKYVALNDWRINEFHVTSQLSSAILSFSTN